MARMIPAVLPAHTKSYGEKQIFQKLKDEPGTKDWIVLHSYDLPDHIKRFSGEIDFLILIPGSGILCIEVKACSFLSRKDGLWFYGKDKKGDPTGPFNQVHEAAHSLRNKIKTHLPHLSRIPVYTAVIFPYVPFRDRPEEWHSWEVIDRDKFRSSQLNIHLKKVVENWRSHFQKTASGTWFNLKSKEPYIEQCEDLAVFLRGDFEIHEGVDSVLERNSHEITKFTEEQTLYLDCMETNRQVIFDGPAGTGKTYLAIEAARRAGKQGKKTIYVCFNKNLAENLSINHRNLENVTITNLHRFLLDITKSAVVNEQAFWERVLPENAQYHLIENENEFKPYDVIIVDEAQDLLNRAYLDFLDLILKGGWSSGEWRIFGDFECQRIYKSGDFDLDKFKIEICNSNTPELTLTINCRNTPRIGSSAQAIGQLQKKYSLFKRSDNFQDPKIYSYSNKEVQLEKLINTLEQFEKDGFHPKDITILSLHDFNDSIAAQLPPGKWKDRLRKYSVPPTGHLFCSTIHAFKGLESQIIILTDFDRISSDRSELMLLYVGISRAIHHVSLFLHDSIKNEVAAIILKSTGGTE